VIALCDEAQEVLEAEPTLLQLSAPIKVFGDIHGQFADLMRLFDQFGSPSREAGDINVVDYLFLGDYVDRGKHSLEVMCLLLALKVQFPQRVFLVRGNHESPEVNARDGFLHECVQRLGGRPAGVAAWRRFNLLFEWLPMGALVNSVILGVHGGIGKYVESPQQIAELPRPLRMGGPHAQLLMDLLWSDPTSSDEVLGVHVNHERTPALHACAHHGVLPSHRCSACT
jgi:diadenosine tetraphosphatase ApaH/serine/threonine PP2A family protein phosphatase